MARIRSVKPEYFDDPDIGQLSAEAALVFIGLWTQADRRGRLLDDPRRLRVRLRPYSAIDFDAVLAELVDAGFVIRYQSSTGVRLIQVRSFEKHQKCHKLEPDSTYPAPDEIKPVATGKNPSNRPVSCLLSLGSGLLSREGETAQPPSLPSPAVVRFAVTGDKANPEWPLTADYLADLQRDYEHVDVLAECKKASAWVKANPGRRKTATGMPKFLVNWLNRAVEKGQTYLAPAASAPRPELGFWRDECDRDHGGTCGNQHFHAAKMRSQAVSA